MAKLYFGNPIAITCTLLFGVNIIYVFWCFLNRISIHKWQIIIGVFILLHGLFWYCANIRDLYSNSIVYATNHNGMNGLFSVESIQSIVFWIASLLIWVLGIVSIFMPQYRKNIFFIIVVVAFIQIMFIEISRIQLYYSIPSKFDYM